MKRQKKCTKQGKRQQNPRDEKFLSQLTIVKTFKNPVLTYRAFLKDDPFTSVGSVFFNVNDKTQASFVPEEHRRKGVVSFLYDYIEKDLGIKLKPDKNLSPWGKLFWQNRLRKNPRSPSDACLGLRKNPLPLNEGNVRRWAFTVLPKYINPRTNKVGLEYFDNWRKDFFEKFEVIYPGTFSIVDKYAKFLDSLSVLSKSDRIKYWRYYLSDSDIFQNALKEYNSIFIENSLDPDEDKNYQWKKFLSNNYLKY